MSAKTTIFLLSAVIIMLLLIILYQRLALKNGLEDKLMQISRKLADILAQDSAESVMAFTDNAALKELISQLNRLLLDRQQLKADFKETEASSKKMLSNISHDIKTPLTVILGYLEILRIDSPEDEALKKIEGKANQVMELINEFFTLAKLEAGDMKLKSERLDLCELCRKNILDFYDILIQKEFEVEIFIPEQSIFIEGDESAINRILFNLISNAVHYGNSGKYIGLSLKENADGSAAVDITDKGKGIDREAARHIFERLYTMEDSRSRSVQGNGLGLTIAKSLALTLGGDILLQSEPDVRTVFTLILPVSRERNS